MVLRVCVLCVVIGGAMGTAAAVAESLHSWIIHSCCRTATPFDFIVVEYRRDGSIRIDRIRIGRALACLLGFRAPRIAQIRKVFDRLVDANANIISVRHSRRCLPGTQCFLSVPGRLVDVKNGSVEEFIKRHKSLPARFHQAACASRHAIWRIGAADIMQRFGESWWEALAERNSHRVGTVCLVCPIVVLLPCLGNLLRREQNKKAIKIKKQNNNNKKE